MLPGSGGAVVGAKNGLLARFMQSWLGRLPALLLPLAVGIAMLRLLARRRPIRRAAFDIGSGGTKMLIADVHPLAGKLVSQPLFELDLPVPFKGDQQVHGRLSEDIQLRGLSVLRAMLRKAAELGAVEACAIATEVFRVAPNGAEFLDRVRALGLSVSVVTQPLEARLGLATAEALAASAPRGLASSSGGTTTRDSGSGIIAWDSGGGSFQITTRAAGPTSLDQPLRNPELRAYTGQIGTSPAFKTLVMQARRQGDSFEEGGPHACLYHRGRGIERALVHTLAGGG
jgi:hypothetical protein